MNPSLPIKILLCVVVVLGLGSASGIVSGSGMTEWYAELNKPFFQPPSWIFGPAWTILYTLIGVAIALVWHSKDTGLKATAIKLFLLQLVVNLIWSPIFFLFKQPLMALVVIIIMWFLILATIRIFSKIDKTAGYLLVPYLCWVTFATMLNAAIVYLN